MAETNDKSKTKKIILIIIAIVIIILACLYGCIAKGKSAPAAQEAPKLEAPAPAPAPTQPAPQPAPAPKPAPVPSPEPQKSIFPDNSASPSLPPPAYQPIAAAATKRSAVLWV